MTLHTTGRARIYIKPSKEALDVLQKIYKKREFDKAIFEEHVGKYIPYTNYHIMDSELVKEDLLSIQIWIS